MKLIKQSDLQIKSHVEEWKALTHLWTIEETSQAMQQTCGQLNAAMCKRV